jgi:hypothetical protein
MRKEADDRERIRKAVGNAVARTIKDIADSDRRLADHLTVCLKRGKNPCYSPEPGVQWET